VNGEVHGGEPRLNGAVVPRKKEKVTREEGRRVEQGKDELEEGRWECEVVTRVALLVNFYCGRFLIEFYIPFVIYF
jgi:hypothetical protein